MKTPQPTHACFFKNDKFARACRSRPCQDPPKGGRCWETPPTPHVPGAGDGRGRVSTSGNAVVWGCGVEGRGCMGCAKYVDRIVGRGKPMVVNDVRQLSFRSHQLLAIRTIVSAQPGPSAMPLNLGLKALSEAPSGAEKEKSRCPGHSSSSFVIADARSGASSPLARSNAGRSWDASGCRCLRQSGSEDGGSIAHCRSSSASVPM